MFFDKRIITSCALERRNREDGQVDRYALGMVVADLDRASGDQTRLSWDGIWTGIRPVGCTTLFVDTIERAFFVSLDSDNVNRVYELHKVTGDDEGPDGLSKIKWSFASSFFFSDKDKFKQKKIDSLVLVYDESSIDGEILASYSPDYHSNVYEMIPSRKNQDPIKPKFDGCEAHTYGNIYGRKSFTPDCQRSSQLGLPETTNVGFSFRIIITGNGHASIRKQLLFAEEHGILKPSSVSDFGCQQVIERSCGEKSLIFNYLIK